MASYFNYNEGSILENCFFKTVIEKKINVCRMTDFQLCQYNKEFFCPGRGY